MGQYVNSQGFPTSQPCGAKWMCTEDNFNAWVADGDEIARTLNAVRRDGHPKLAKLLPKIVNWEFKWARAKRRANWPGLGVILPPGQVGLDRVARTVGEGADLLVALEGKLPAGADFDGLPTVDVWPYVVGGLGVLIAGVAGFFGFRYVKAKQKELEDAA